MNYFPTPLSYAQLILSLECEKIKIALLTNIVSNGLVRYKYIIAVKHWSFEVQIISSQ